MAGTALYERHLETLQRALTAIRERGYWSNYPEIPSGKIYGPTAAADGQAAYEAHLGKDFDLQGLPGVDGTVAGRQGS